MTQDLIFVVIHIFLFALLLRLVVVPCCGVAAFGIAVRRIFRKYAFQTIGVPTDNGFEVDMKIMLPWALYTSALLLCVCPSTKGLSTVVEPATTRTPVSIDDSNTSPTYLQRLAFEIASSFKTSTFDPLIKDRHVQTIGGFFLRDTPAAYLPRDKPIESAKRIIKGIKIKSDRYKQKKPKFWYVRDTIETPDGDFFHADTKFANDETASMVIMLHGLESNSDSDFSHQIASACVANGMSFTCVNFRSCSADGDGNLIPNSKLWGCEWNGQDRESQRR